MPAVRIFAPLERPTTRPARRWAFDVAVGAAAFATSLPYLYRSDPHPGPAAFAALAVVACPLVVRRVWPVAVFGVVLLLATVANAADESLAPGFAVLVALYTVAVLAPRGAAAWSATFCGIALVAGAVREDGVAAWPSAVLVSGLVVAATGLGLYTSTRRAYLAELEDRARRLERERDQQGALAAAGERARIAREMHDIVAHHLMVMVTLSDGAVAASGSSPDRAAEVMRNVAQTGREALSDTRRLLGVLRRPSSGTDGADHADDVGDGLHQPLPDLSNLDALVDQVRSSGLDITFTVHGAVDDLPPAMQLTVYRLVQESLTNTMKHAGAPARATVRLHRRRDELEVEVLDDGGVRPHAPDGIGGGLIGMQERVQAFGGAVDSGPRQPAGWEVRARIPIESADPSEGRSGESTEPTPTHPVSPDALPAALARPQSTT